MPWAFRGLFSPEPGVNSAGQAGGAARGMKRISFLASESPVAQAARRELKALYGHVAPEDAEVIVALGGDGFMLQTLHGTEHLPVPVYGMNRGTVGFLMNEYSIVGLHQRLLAAEETIINPLAMRISIDGRVRLEELVCDGALVSTPAGSTAYNYSAHGPILPIGAEALALTAIAPFRPRRWRGALLPKRARVRFDVLDHDKRPVMADADSRSVRDVVWVEVESEPQMAHRLLFDPGHGLEERLLREQFE